MADNARGVKTKRNVDSPLWGGKVGFARWYDGAWHPERYGQYLDLCEQGGGHSIITYETSNFKRFCNCRHLYTSAVSDNTFGPYDLVLYQWDGNDYRPLEKYYGIGPGHVEYQQAGRTGPLYPVSPTQLTPIVPDLDYKSDRWGEPPSPLEFCERACKAISPKVEEDISLFNFLYELKDIKSIFTGPVQMAKQFIAQWKTGKLRSLMNLTASMILQDAYVNKTTVHDITQMYVSLMEFANRVDSMWENQHKSVSGHYTERYFAKEVDQGRISEDKWYFQKNWTYQGEKRYTCTMRYHYVLLDAFGNPIVDRSQFYSLFRLQQFGINLNPKYIWDAIPLSFVVDWFVNVGDVLGNYRIDNYQYAVYLEDCCYSIKEVATGNYVTRRFVTRYLGGPRDGKYYPCAYAHYEAKRKQYDRIRFMPRREWLGAGTAWEFNAPSKRQWVLGGALLPGLLRGAL